MATLAQKIDSERRMRELLDRGGLPQPDRVEYGFTCIRLIFEEPKLVVVIDIDDPGDTPTPAEAIDGDTPTPAEAIDGDVPSPVEAGDRAAPRRRGPKPERSDPP
jgi:hypothetical protein